MVAPGGTVLAAFVFAARTIRLGTSKRKGGTLEYDTESLSPSLALELKELKLAQGASEMVFVRKLGKGVT